MKNINRRSSHGHHGSKRRELHGATRTLTWIARMNTLWYVVLYCYGALQAIVKEGENDTSCANPSVDLLEDRTSHAMISSEGYIALQKTT